VLWVNGNEVGCVLIALFDTPIFQPVSKSTAQPTDIDSTAAAPLAISSASETLVW
jgi:hypothetical protein